MSQEPVTAAEIEAIVRREIEKLCEKIDSVLFVFQHDGSKTPATVSAIIAVDRAGRAIQAIIRPEERDSLLKFFSGQDQWDARVLSKREGQGRACFTLNRLPAILAKIVAASRLAGENPSEGDIQEVALYLTRQYGDAQRMINYFFTQLLEIAQEPRPHYFIKPEDQVKAS